MFKGFALFFISVIAFGDSSPERVTLEAAKKYAIANNLQIKALRHEMVEREAIASAVQSAFYPTVGLAGGPEHRSGSSAIQSYFYANLNLFNGFTDSYRSQIAGIEAEMSRIRLRQEEFSVGLDVEQQFHFYLLKKITLAQRKKALELNRTHRQMAKQKQSSGMASISDVMEFDLRESLLQSDVELLQQELEESRIQFRKLLGEDVGSAIEPLGNLEHQHLVGNFAEHAKLIKDHSEKIRLASRELAKANLESRLWQSSWLPKLDLETQVGYLSLDDRPQDGSASAKASAVAKFDLFNGFRSQFERKEGEAKKLKAEAKLKTVIQDALTGAEVAFRRLMTIQARVDIEDKNDDRSEKYYAAVVSEYRRGVKNSADVKSAAEGMFEAKIRRENFKYDFLKQRIDLERSLGTTIAVERVEDSAK